VDNEVKMLPLAAMEALLRASAAQVRKLCLLAAVVVDFGAGGHCGGAAAPVQLPPRAPSLCSHEPCLPREHPAATLGQGLGDAAHNPDARHLAEGRGAANARGACLFCFLSSSCFPYPIHYHLSFLVLLCAMDAFSFSRPLLPLPLSFICSWSSAVLVLLDAQGELHIQLVRCIVHQVVAGAL
jgi:hypothetical protein